MLASDSLVAPFHWAWATVDTTIVMDSVGSSESSLDIVQSVLSELRHIRSYVSRVLTRQLTHITQVKSQSQMTDLTSDLTFGTLGPPTQALLWQCYSEADLLLLLL